MERFYDPDFTAYDFLSLFSAVSITENIHCFNRDNLIDFINLCKKDAKFNKLLDEMNLKSNGIKYYSEEFDEAVSKLKWGKILYTVSPESDSTICIFKDIPTQELIKPRVNHLEETITFINEYKEYENNKINNNQLILKK